MEHKYTNNNNRANTFDKNIKEVYKKKKKSSHIYKRIMDIKNIKLAICQYKSIKGT